MKKSLLKKNSILNIMNSSLITLPTPLNISIMWNFGSLLGMCLAAQITTGLLLSLHYCPNINLAFNSITHIMQNVNYGWMMRFSHMNGASMFFMCMFIHIGRGVYFNSFLFKKTWMTGVTIMLLSMATAFLGYVLPWGQMSFWGATVITNLVSAIPLIGKTVVLWLWGGFSINNATLNRFYSFHFIAPFVVMFMMIIHLFFLHETGSSNPMGLNSNLFKIPFNPYYSLKDLMGFILMLMMLMSTCALYPYLFSDPENYNKANPMITPVHIQPEWYFLFAYAILRSIPNKLGGVVALIMSILILMIMPMMPKYKFKGFKFYMFNQIMFYMFISIFIMLTWVGAKPIEPPYLIIGQIYSTMYFLFYITYPYISKISDKWIMNFK
uniref:Cytochrome b n=1 Tax=Encyrtus infelix TaxID=355422 RepID=A0A411FRH9_9HYME|nr:cytochrome b [Encyrtus infelix]QBA96091.1 cytochrome b [Encyrtus infelix]QBA96104.1 cytochrome b [Encyrtus infelix]